MDRPQQPIAARWRARAQRLKGEIYALCLAYRDPRVPWYAKALGACVVAYALSPVDLIPDFIPVLGYLDDIVLLPMGIALTLKMIPPDVMAECRQQAAARLDAERSRGIIVAATAAIIAVWLLLLAGALVYIFGVI